jgi:hypothetical protein
MKLTGAIRLTAAVVWLPLATLAAAPATGPLRVNPVNPLYFTDGTGKTVYLGGHQIEVYGFNANGKDKARWDGNIFNGKNNVNRGAPGPDLAADGNPGTETVWVTVANSSRAPLADSPKGMWGRVTPIADGNHPNLYYNQGEIDGLRQMIRNPGAPSQSGRDVVPPVTREAKTMVAFPNWYSRFMGPSLACALVSGNQAAVDYWADSGWPHDLFTFDGVTFPGGAYPSDAANPEHPGNGVLYGVDVTTSEALFRKTLPWRVSVDDYWPHWVDPSYEYLSLTRGPDDFIWTYLKNVLIRIDPRDTRIHVVGKIDPVGLPTFVGNDLYFSGSEHLRRIRNLTPAP